MNALSFRLFFALCSSAGTAVCLAQTPIQASGPLIVTESNQTVVMRDGINISVDIYRPAQNGSFPTLYAAAPYPHTDDNSPPDNAGTGPVAWFVSQGFNYVIANSRGTGLSEGNYDFLSREEQQDHYEIIEWIADQTWSDGRVLGVGSGYYASAQWQMAVQNPPSLSCIAPVNGVLQPYQDWVFPGGLADSTFLQNWYENRVRRDNAFPDSGPSRLVDYDMRLQMLTHPGYDNYWQIRSSLPYIEAINIPVFIAGSWEEQESTLAANLNARTRLNNIRKMAIYSTDVPLMQDQTFLEQDLLPFYHWCLQSQNAADFASRPDLRYQTRGQNLWQTAETWPPADATQTPLFLNRQSPDATEPATLDFAIQSNSISLSRYGDINPNSSLDQLIFISGPLPSNLEIAGPLMFELYASSSERDTAFRVELSEVFTRRQLSANPNIPVFLRNFLETAQANNSGTISVPVSSGTLKASMRTSREGSADNFQPEYLFTGNAPLSPSQVTRFDIAMQPVAHRFLAGSRLVVTITQMDDDSLAGLGREDSIFHSQRYPSRLWLPVRSGAPTTVSTAAVQEEQEEIFIELQSQLTEEPDAAFTFDQEFSTELSGSDAGISPGDEVGDAVIFISPGITETDSPADQSPPR